MQLWPSCLQKDIVEVAKGTVMINGMEQQPAR